MRIIAELKTGALKPVKHYSSNAFDPFLMCLVVSFCIFENEFFLLKLYTKLDDFLTIENHSPDDNIYFNYLVK